MVGEYIEEATADTEPIKHIVPIDAEAEREMALIMRASLIAIADSMIAMRAGVLAVVGALERRYQIPAKKPRNKP